MKKSLSGKRLQFREIEIGIFIYLNLTFHMYYIFEMSSVSKMLSMGL